MKVNIGLSGFGNVGKNFVQLLLDKQEIIKDLYELEINIVALLRRSGGIISAKGIPFEQLLRMTDASSLGFSKDLGIDDIMDKSCAEVWVEATPTDINTGEPGLTNILKAFERGMHVVSLSKGPLVYDFARVMNCAQKAKVCFLYSGATAAALPTVDVALHSLAGSFIDLVEGILNGTSNYVLTAMERGLIDFEEALASAQEKGIAEPDPSLDIDGWDTASKMIIIANSIYRRDFGINDIRVTGISKVSLLDLKNARSDGGTIKLLGTSEVKEGKIIMKVEPTFIDSEHPLAKVAWTTKGIHFRSDTMGPLTVIGGFSSPRGAAAAALKDIISIYR